MTKSSSRGVSRRRLFSIGGGAIAVSGVAALTPPGAKAADQPLAADTRMVTATEGTNICAVVSPDGKTVAFDVYAMLWLIPVEGGPARRLTEEIYEIAQPDWSPDGKTLAFQSYRDGNFHVWTIGADGTGLKQLTKGAFDCREPRWSPDGRKIAFSSDRGGRYGVHLLDVASGEITAFSSGPTDELNPRGRRTARASPSPSTRSASTSRGWTGRGGQWSRSRPRPTGSTPPRWPAPSSRRTARTWSSPPSRTARPSCATPPA